MTVDQAYAVASRIEQVHAMDRANLMRARGRKTDWRSEYDALAATELAEFILRTERKS